MDFYFINGVQMPPVTMNDTDYSDLDDEKTTRKENGVLHRERIRSNVRKVKIKHEMVTESEKEVIIAATSGVFFLYSGEGGTFQAYRGDLQTSKRGWDGQGWRYDIAFNIIEK